MNEPINFYVPRRNRPPFDAPLKPEDMDEIASWYGTTDFVWSSGATTWLWVTHVELKARGFETRLVDEIPDRGIFVATAHELPLLYRPKRHLYYIAVAADSPPRFFAHAHILQNPSQVTKVGSSFADPVAIYLPLWPQPGLRSRDPRRGVRFERIAYLGAKDQMDPALDHDELRNAAADLGIEIEFRFDRFSHHDYQDIDAILAVRSFDDRKYQHKPASKLINAWHAGVPAILGKESAYRSLRVNELDFLEVISQSEIISAMKRLKENLELRTSIIDNGRLRAEQFSNDAIAQRWIDFLSNQVQTAHARVRKGGPAYHILFQADQAVRRLAASAMRRVGYRLGGNGSDRIH